MPVHGVSSCGFWAELQPSLGSSEAERGVVRAQGDDVAAAAATSRNETENYAEETKRLHCTTLDSRPCSQFSSVHV